MFKLPGVNLVEAVRALEKAGFRIIRQGKHIVMTDGERLVTIPRQNPIKAFTMGGIVKARAFPLNNSRHCFEVTHPTLHSYRTR